MHRILYVFAVALCVWVFLIEPQLTYVVQRQPVTVVSSIEFFDNDGKACYECTVMTDDGDWQTIQTYNEMVMTQTHVHLTVNNRNQMDIECYD
jgi:hypothetical protein